ncbi:hypothetical protein Mapa_001876 [Marchantia paleacea]|nr:hypothetical protein Mapa_001876 [Marchantia paleacea]
MLIPLKCSCGDCQEWAMIELQGSIEIQQSGLLERIQALTIGTLCKRAGGKFTFTVGYHELEGSQVALKKPLLILKSRTQEVQDDNSMEIDSTGNASKQEPKAELQVIGIIRHKLLFKNRPKALISKPEVKVKGRVKG